MKKNGIAATSREDKVFDFIVHCLAVLIILSVVYPLYFIIIASISNSVMVSTGQVVLWPKGFSLFGYQEILKDTRIWIGYRNTIFYTLFGTLVNMMLTLPAAYTLSRKEFRARRPLMFFFVFTMFFNGGLVPTYILMRDVNILNSVWVFIIPFAVNVYNLIIVRTFFEVSIPKDLYEAASLDGCTHFRYFLTVVIPLSKAVISVISLYYLVQHWNDFYTALIYVRDNELMPLQMILRDILISNQVFSQGAGAGGAAGGYAQQYADQVKYAVIIVSTLPILCVYPFIQKYFEKGVMIGAVKG